MQLVGNFVVKQQEKLAVRYNFLNENSVGRMCQNRTETKLNGFEMTF